MLVSCFKIGLGDNGISRFGGKDYGGLLLHSWQFKFIRLNFTSVRSLVYINNNKSRIELTTFARQNRIVNELRLYVYHDPWLVFSRKTAVLGVYVRLKREEGAGSSREN
jgi:hypothetical protein